MKRYVSLASAICVFFSPVALTGPASDKIAQRVVEPYRGYAKTCGYPILFGNITTISQARIHARLGPIIVLDPVLSYPAQAAHRRFLIAHECAHHKLKHTTRAGLSTRVSLKKGVENQELSADCWAAEALVKAGLNSDVRFMVDAFYRKGLMSPGSGYPSGVQRSTLIYHCMNSALRERATSQDSSDTKQ